ncbi:MAG: DUF922 domain-containing protein [Pseudomonadota bacterium]
MKVTVKVPKPKDAKWKVKGKTIEELFKNLEKHKWWGRYRSHETEKASPDKGDKTKVGSIAIGGAPVITMPNWVDYPKVSKPKQQSFDTMYKELLRHENEHHKIFTDACEAFKKTLEKGDPVETKKWPAMWNKFKSDTQKLQNQHDARTGHGKKDGVVLNVPDES